MTYRTRWRIATVWAHLLAFTLIACGDEAASTGDVVLEVRAPAIEGDDAIVQLDYEIACDQGWSTLDAGGAFVPATLRRGGMLAGPPAAASEAPWTSTWQALEEPLDGLCLLHLIARNVQQETVCRESATFEARAGEPMRIDTTMRCSKPPSFAGVASLSADLPDAGFGDEGPQTVEFTIACRGRGASFFEGVDAGSAAVALNGNLEVMDDVDRGLRVEESFADLPIGECALELRVPDRGGEYICFGNDDFVILPDRATELPVVIICNL